MLPAYDITGSVKLSLLGRKVLLGDFFDYSQGKIISNSNDTFSFVGMKKSNNNISCACAHFLSIQLCLCCLLSKLVIQ